MKIVKYFAIFFLITSCNNYFGTVEEDYIPTNDLREVSLNKIKLSSDSKDFVIGEALYPYQKRIYNNNFINIKKISSINENSRFLFLEDKIYFNDKNYFYKINKHDSKKISKYKLELDKEEEIIHITQFDNIIYILTNKGKIYKYVSDIVELVNDLKFLLNNNVISKGSKIIVFTVFGEIFEINLNDNTFSKSGNFQINHGVNISSNLYNYLESEVILYNSGTPIFIDSDSNKLKTNFYLEDLNILSELGIFEELIDAPFAINNFIFFIEKKGLISVFNPILYQILWETDIVAPIQDYLIDKNYNLYILTFNKIYIFSAEGILHKEITHNVDKPLTFWINNKNFYLPNKDGLSIIDINGLTQNFINQNFVDFFRILKSDSVLYFADSKNLYSISE